jgi:hypothetical protein
MDPGVMGRLLLPMLSRRVESEVQCPSGPSRI